MAVPTTLHKQILKAILEKKDAILNKRINLQDLNFEINGHYYDHKTIVKQAGELFSGRFEPEKIRKGDEGYEEAYINNIINSYLHGDKYIHDIVDNDQPILEREAVVKKVEEELKEAEEQAKTQQVQQTAKAQGQTLPPTPQRGSAQGSIPFQGSLPGLPGLSTGLRGTGLISFPKQITPKLASLPQTPRQVRLANLRAPGIPRPKIRRSLGGGMTSRQARLSNLRIPRIPTPIRGGLGGLIRGGFGQGRKLLPGRGGRFFGGRGGFRGGARSLATRRRVAQSRVGFAIGAAVVILALGAIFFGLFGGGTQPIDPNELAKQLTITKSGPASVSNPIRDPRNNIVGPTITYQITIQYQGSGSVNVEVTDPVPNNTDCKEISDSGRCENRVVSWPSFPLTQGQSKTLSWVALPTSDNVWVVNQADAKISPVGGTGGSPIGPGNVFGVNDFNTLMRGQGRNTNVLGDEENFVRTVVTNGKSLVAGKETYLREIYRGATSKQVNPLAILVIWGTETGFRLDLSNYALSCPVRESTSFHEQVVCASNTYNFWMKHFEGNNVNGKLTLTQNCIYDDPFIFATEKYGPTCSIYDGNDHFLSNFVKYYKTFLGAP